MNRRLRVIFALLAIALTIGGWYYANAAAPYRLNQSPTVAYRIVPLRDRISYAMLHKSDWPGLTDHQIDKYPYSRTTPVPDDLRFRLIRILNSRSTYANVNSGSACYEPRLALTFGEGTDRIDVFICLECRWVHFIKRESDTGKALSPRAIEELRPIAHALFGPDAAPIQLPDLPPTTQTLQ